MDDPDSKEGDAAAPPPVPALATPPGGGAAGSSKAAAGSAGGGTFTSLISRLWTSPSPVEAPRVGSGIRQTIVGSNRVSRFSKSLVCVFVCISCDDRNHPGAGGCGAWAVLSRFGTPDGTNAAARKRSSTLKCAMAIAVAVLAESIPRAEEMTLATTGGAA